MQMTVVLNTARAANPQGYTGTPPVGLSLPVHRAADGKAFVKLRDIRPLKVVVLTNHSEADE